MSMNISIMAVRAIWYKDNDGNLCPDNQEEYFDHVFQTSTSVTYEILRSSEDHLVRLNGYIDYASRVGEETKREEPVYAADDHFQEREPVGTRWYNPADYHLEELNYWIEQKKRKGWEILVEMV
jgi:hypothetical protein